MNKTTEGLSASARTLYDSLNVADDEIRGELEEMASRLIGARRHSTEESFALGAYLERAAELLPDGLLEKWVVQRCDYTSRHVRTYRAIHRNLSGYKDTLVALAVGSTVLGKLSAAEPEKIEQAIGFAMQHRRLRVADVTEILAGAKQSDGDARLEESPYDIGGAEGLKAIIAIKVRNGLKSFLDHVEEIRTYVAAALLEKRVVKKTLAEQIHLTARLARKELESLAQFVMPNPEVAYVIWETKLPAHTNWKAVGDLLHKIGGVDTWPEVGNLHSWLENEVLPILEWASAKTKGPAWPLSATVLSPLKDAAVTEASSTTLAEPDDQPSEGGTADRVADELEPGTEAASINESDAKRIEGILAPFGANVTIERPKSARRAILEEKGLVMPLAPKQRSGHA